MIEPNHTQRIDTLDSLRGLAALTVVIHHCMLVFPVFWAVYDPLRVDKANNIFIKMLAYSPLHLMWGGFEAVILFFVLSGFVLSLPFLNGKTPSYFVYATKRICRIYLPYLTLIVLAAILHSILYRMHTPTLSYWYYQWWSRPIDFQMIVDHLLMMGSDDQNILNPVIWSLVHEMRISLLFPLMIWMVIKLNWKQTAIAAVGLIPLASGLGKLHIPTTIGHSIGYASLFLAGATLAKYRYEIVGYLAARSSATRAILLGVALLLINIRWQLPTLRIPESLIIGLGSLLLIALALVPGKFATFLDRPALLWLGKVSYSLYLVHVIILLTVCHIVQGPLLGPIVLVGVPLLSLVAAHILYEFVERPSMLLGKHLTASSLRQVPGRV
ncbi:O-acetyltransferase OatA [compost metagenome]